MIGESLRHGIFMFFIILLAFVGLEYFKMTFFEYFMSVGIAAIVMKLTDISERIVK